MFAHSLPGQPEADWEDLGLHLHNVADLAQRIGAPLNLGRWAYLAGLLHDLGKTSAAFQARLRGDRSSVDHSSAGAREAVRRWGSLGKVLAYAVAGHHSGLPNGAELHERCHAKSLERYDPQFVALPDNLPDIPFGAGDPLLAPGLFIRMIFSCLVDADYLATESILAPEIASRRGHDIAPDELIAGLEWHLDRLANKPTPGPLDAERRAIQDACRDAAGQTPGLFSLTVPTGGGKTLASLLFALHHARHHGLRRVIYAIPYTSIIEQTAAVFREALGPEAVLEHHCNHSHPDSGDGEGQDAYAKMRLDAQNWNAPVVVTTNVQLFESLFAARPSRCRRLHAIAGSVLVLDEAQMLPVQLLRPCIAALRELAVNYWVSPVLCTATQPALERSDWLRDGLDGVREIAPNPEVLHEQFRRVEVAAAGAVDDDALAEALAARDQVLCIVNTRAHAAELYRKLCDRLDDGGAVHLSARMCAVHRSARLTEIRAELAAGRPCRVVSTQLVEAGVDVDFPEVFRALAGLDSLAQAAGRCNREKRWALGTVHLFAPEQDLPMADWQRRIACGRQVLETGADPLSPNAQRDFFRRLYDLEGARLDAPGILRMLGEGAAELEFRFREAADAFRFIESPMEPVIVPYDARAREWIDRLASSATPGADARALDPYVVQIPQQELGALMAAGAVETLHDSFQVLRNEGLYDEQLGLCAEDPTYRSAHSHIV